ncbi:MAG: hypothetical protein AAF628_37890, partial [Planctomycetota bacterium]
MIPRPRVNLTTYAPITRFAREGPRYGVSAPAASGRELVVPEEEPGEDGASEEARGDGDGATATTRRRRYSGAELMNRVFETDVLRCPACGGVRK